MNPLGHYLRLHLTGSAAGIELFGRGDGLHEQQARQTIGDIREELVDERRQLLAMTEQAGFRPAPLAAVVARVGERLGRLKPNGDLLQRTPLTDVIDLESMCIAVAGKIAGWEALLAGENDLPRDQLEALLEQARRQHRQISELHARAAARALGS